MAISPKFKLITPAGDYIGSAKTPDAAGHFVRTMSDGAVVRYGSTSGPILYRTRAGEGVATTIAGIVAGLRAYQDKAAAKLRAAGL